jgi:hypothetical protein
MADDDFGAQFMDLNLLRAMPGSFSLTLKNTCDKNLPPI